MEPYNEPSWPFQLVRLPCHRPFFYIMRPGNQVVPLIPVDELPGWLQVVQNFPLEPRDMHPASMGQFPRFGEYDIICLYCSSALEGLFSKPTKPTDPPEVGLSEASLIDRGYPGSSIFFFHHYGRPLQNVTWKPSLQEQDLLQFHTRARLNPNGLNTRASTFNPVFGGSRMHHSSSGSNELSGSHLSRRSQHISCPF